MHSTKKSVGSEKNESCISPQRRGGGRENVRFEIYLYWLSQCCVITVCYNEEGYPDVKGNGCMRGVLYANDKVRAMDEKETDK